MIPHKSYGGPSRGNYELEEKKMELNILHNDKIIYTYELNLTKFVEESAKKGNILVELSSGKQIPAECCVKNLEF